jgi:hypothetical protein
MDEASNVRATALELTSNIERTPLGERIDTLLQDASMTPGALTVLTARTLGGDEFVDAAATRGVGVQLSYEGLRLARALVHDDAIWEAEDRTDGYIELLVSEVLVSRGFYHLARTEASDTAIQTVRRFARNQTRRQVPNFDPADLEGTLESDILRLAVEAGATLVYPDPPAEAMAYADRLAEELDTTPLPDAEVALAGAREELRGITVSEPTADRSATADQSR